MNRSMRRCWQSFEVGVSANIWKCHQFLPIVQHSIQSVQIVPTAPRRLAHCLGCACSGVQFPVSLRTRVGSDWWRTSALSRSAVRLLGEFGSMEGLRRADAEVYAATHPGVRVRGRINRYNPRLRWKLSRYNPANKWRLAKYKTTHPVEFEKAKVRSRFNYMNPLFYIRRIKYNLTHAGRRHHTTTVY